MESVLIVHVLGDFVVEYFVLESCRSCYLLNLSKKSSFPTQRCLCCSITVPFCDAPRLIAWIVNPEAYTISVFLFSSMDSPNPVNVSLNP